MRDVSGHSLGSHCLTSEKADMGSWFPHPVNTSQTDTSLGWHVLNSVDCARVMNFAIATHYCTHNTFLQSAHLFQ